MRHQERALRSTQGPAELDMKNPLWVLNQFNFGENAWKVQNWVREQNQLHVGGNTLLDELLNKVKHSAAKAQISPSGATWCSDGAPWKWWGLKLFQWNICMWAGCAVKWLNPSKRKQLLVCYIHTVSSRVPFLNTHNFICWGNFICTVHVCSSEAVVSFGHADFENSVTQVVKGEESD